METKVQSVECEFKVRSGLICNKLRDCGGGGILSSGEGKGSRLKNVSGEWSI